MLVGLETAHLIQKLLHGWSDQRDESGCPGRAVPKRSASRPAACEIRGSRPEIVHHSSGTNRLGVFSSSSSKLCMSNTKLSSNFSSPLVGKPIPLLFHTANAKIFGKVSLGDSPSVFLPAAIPGRRPPPVPEIPATVPNNLLDPPPAIRNSRSSWRDKRGAGS